MNPIILRVTSAIALVAIGTASAQQDNFARDTAKAAEEIMTDPKAYLGFDPLKAANQGIQKYQLDADDIAQAARAHIANQATPDKNTTPQVRDPATQIQVFLNIDQVATSIPTFQAELTALRDKGITTHLTINIRGLSPSMSTINDLMKAMTTQLNGLDMTDILVQLDFNSFKKAGITSTPTLILGPTDSPVLTAKGAWSIDWFLSQYKAGSRGDLGKFGETDELRDRDLMEILQERIRQYDWQNEQENAANRYWERYPYEVLPRVTETKIRYIDPTFEVTEDIKTPTGQYIAQAGSRFNPTDYVYGHRIWLFIDARDEEQVKWAKRLLSDKAVPISRYTLITAGIGGTPGFDTHANLEDALNLPVYLLDESVKKKFQIRALPTTVRVQDRLIVVKEHNMLDPITQAHETGLSSEGSAP